MLKTYLRYEAKLNLGVINSNAGGLNFSIDGKHVFAPGLENIHVWSLKKGSLEFILEGEESSLVTATALNKDGTRLAVGHLNGHIEVWDVTSMEERHTFHGHKGAVTCLSFDESGSRLVSGANDTDVVVWDLIGEQGICRLRGHTNALTQVQFFGAEGKYLLSSSKDGFLKIWNLEIEHCVQTLIGHEKEVWCFEFLYDDEYLVTGGKDLYLFIWKKQPKEDPEVNFEYVRLGEINRIHGTKKRYNAIHVGPYKKLLFCQTLSKGCDVYRIRTEEQMRKKEKRRKKRAKEKKKNNPDEDVEIPEGIIAADLLEALLPMRTDTEIQYITVSAGKKRTIRVLVGLKTNMIEEYRSKTNDNEKLEFEKKRSVELSGHRMMPRAVCFGKNENILGSVSGSEVKVWDLEEQNSIRTLECPDGLNMTFGPSDRYIFATTKTGKLLLYDIPSATLVETFDAHTGAVWALEMTSDGKGLVTAGADHEVKFWSFIIQKSESVSRLSLVQTRVLQLTDEVMDLKVSDDLKYVACALADQTIRVFFFDSLKFAFSLYGHRLPALCLDISSDSYLLVSGGADKNVKIWGLDFGDLHKSLFAHNDRVTDVRFVPDTHYFFSSGRDGTIKYWDGDKFEKILTLNGHNQQVWGLRLSKSGRQLASCGSDMSVRVWEETDEQLVLEEEQQKELETMYDRELNQVNESKPTAVVGSGLPEQQENARATTSNLATRDSGERITMALEMVSHERKRKREWEAQPDLPEAKRAKFKPNPELFGREPLDYLLSTIAKIEGIHLEEALMVLPFDYARTLLENLNLLLDEPNPQLELIMRCLISLVREYQSQISTSQILRPLVLDLKTKARKRIREYRDELGFNLSAMKFMLSKAEESQDRSFFEDREQLDEEKKKSGS